MCMRGKLAATLTAFGALNWAIAWLADFDVAARALGAERTTGSDALRILVAFSALYLLVLTFRKPKPD